jgi:hypothetical protein
MKIDSKQKEQDKLRDQAIRALFHLVSGLLYHPVTEIKAAAEKVHHVLAHYGLSINDESYAVESSLVRSMLADLNEAGLQDAIASLSGCAELMNRVQLAEDNFQATRIAYEKERGRETTLENATSIKMKVVTELNKKLVVHLRAMEQAYVETYGPFARTVAEIIANNNEVVKRRSKKKSPMA